ncbi:MAG TPA: DNA recombination protein RmuC [Jiangellaceae bacterium]|nr:DNA recombination protein RmuC [Jiangellaceae bacterium]
MEAIDLLLLALGTLVGCALGALAARSRSAGAAAERDAARAERDTLRAERDAVSRERAVVEATLREVDTERVRLAAELRHARAAADEQQRLENEFERLSAMALRRNNEQFLQLAGEHLKSKEHRAVAELEQRRQAVEQLVRPLADQLGKVEAQLGAVERTRAEAYAELREQVRGMNQTSDLLRAETSQLVAALRAPQVRGRWGELQLRRVVEAAGMLAHVDFSEQETADTADGRLRPDLVVRLAGGKQVVVDSKVSFNGYLEAMEARDDATHSARLAAHARHLKGHIDALAAKRYWDQFEPAPEFVVMFVPAEVFLNAALEQDPTLLEHAFDRNVVIATPATLVALLRTVAYTWRQEALASNAARVLSLGKELHGRLSTMGGHVSKLGRQLDGAVRAFNETVSSIESRVLVTARKMADLGVTDAALGPADQLDRVTRRVQAPELVASATDALVAIDEIEADARYGVDPPPVRPARDGTEG